MDIKSLVFIITTACIAAGYYYKTESRLDDAEREIKFLWSSVGELQKQNKRNQNLSTTVKYRCCCLNYHLLIYGQ